MKIQTTRNQGIHITIGDWCISAQWGIGNYCDTRSNDGEMFTRAMTEMRRGDYVAPPAQQVEVAVINDVTGQWVSRSEDVYSDNVWGWIPILHVFALAMELNAYALDGKDELDVERVTEVTRRQLNDREKHDVE
jgi:hypothetical protein